MACFLPLVSGFRRFPSRVKWSVWKVISSTLTGGIEGIGCVEVAVPVVVGNVWAAFGSAALLIGAGVAVPPWLQDVVTRRTNSSVSSGKALKYVVVLLFQ